MRQHQSANAVADGVDPFHRRTTLVVNDDETPVVELNARIIRKQILRHRATPHRDDEFFDGERLRSVLVRVRHVHAFLAYDSLFSLGAQADIEPLLLEFARSDLGHVAIRHEQEIVHCLDYRHLGAEA